MKGNQNLKTLSDTFQMIGLGSAFVDWLTYTVHCVFNEWTFQICLMLTWIQWNNTTGTDYTFAAEKVLLVLYSPSTHEFKVCAREHVRLVWGRDALCVCSVAELLNFEWGDASRRRGKSSLWILCNDIIRFTPNWLHALGKLQMRDSFFYSFFFGTGW